MAGPGAETPVASTAGGSTGAVFAAQAAVARSRQAAIVGTQNLTSVVEAHEEVDERTDLRGKMPIREIHGVDMALERHIVRQH